MTVVDTLAERNDDAPEPGSSRDCRHASPAADLVVGCVDPRVDPAHVLGLETGDAAVIRNVGGRVTPDVLAELALLGRLARSLIGSAAPVIDLIIMQHTTVASRACKIRQTCWRLLRRRPHGPGPQARRRPVRGRRIRHQRPAERTADCRHVPDHRRRLRRRHGAHRHRPLRRKGTSMSTDDLYLITGPPERPARRVRTALRGRPAGPRIRPRRTSGRRLAELGAEVVAATFWTSTR